MRVARINKASLRLIQVIHCKDDVCLGIWAPSNQSTRATEYKESALGR